MVKQLLKNNIYIVVAVLLVSLTVCYLLYTRTEEGFQSDETSQNVAYVSEENTNNDECECADKREWYETSSIKSIYSRFFGIGINVSPATDMDNANINSKYLVFIESNNEDIPKGALSLDDQGTYSVQVPNGYNPEQQWEIKLIKSADDFKLLDSNVELNDNEKFPFAVVVKKNESSGIYHSLHYDNGSIGVRPLHNYETQKWIIGKDSVSQPAIQILNTNQYTKLTPEYRESDTTTASAVAQRQAGYDPSTQNLMLQQLTNSNQAEVMRSIEQIVNLLQKEGKMETPSETTFGKKPLTINLRLQGNPDKVVDAVQGTEGFQDNSVVDLLNSYEAEQLKPKQQEELNSFKKGKISKGCPAVNMNDYISTTGIPCTACANF